MQNSNSHDAVIFRLSKNGLSVTCGVWLCER